MKCLKVALVCNYSGVRNISAVSYIHYLMDCVHSQEILALPRVIV